MKSPLSLITSFAAPIIIIFLAYSFIGPIGGYVFFALFILLALFRSRSVFMTNRANNKYSNGNFEGALKDLKGAVSADPKSSRIRGVYAYLLLKLGYTDEAGIQIGQALKDVTRIQEKNSLRLTKALVLWKQDKIDDAISELTDLLEIYETTSVYATLGFLYIDKGDLKQALEFNLRAKEYNSGNAIILDNLGRTYILQGDYDKASDIYKEVMKLNPAFPEVYCNYARVLDKKGDAEQALTMVKRALSMRFWNISTIKKEEVEAFLVELESRQQSQPTSQEKIESIHEKSQDSAGENSAF